MRYLGCQAGDNWLSLLGFQSGDANHSIYLPVDINLGAGNNGDSLMIRRLTPLIAATMLFLSACANNFGQGSESYQDVDKDPEVQKTWNEAYVIVSKTERGRLNDPKMQAILTEQKSKPVVLFFHGCRGLSNGQIGDLNGFANDANAAGYIVVAPDSFARSSRETGCVDRAMNWDIHRMRIDEVAYSVQTVKTQPWADPNNVFLFGHSEGGHAVSRYRGDDINAIVFSGWGCTTYTKGGRGQELNPQPVAAGPSIPVMNFKSANDEIDSRTNECGSSVWGRPGGSKVVVPTSGHWVFDSSVYRQEVIVFFDRNRHSGVSEPTKEINK